MTEPDELTALRALRDETARRHGGDAWSLVRELAERTRAAGREAVRLPRREPSPQNPAAKPAA